MEQPQAGQEIVEEESADDLASAESFIRQAHIAKVRGNKQEADSLLQKAIEAAPNSATVLEAVGDDYMDRRQTKKAMETYGLAVKKAPGNVSLERKHAEAVLAVQGIVDPFSAMASDSGTMASAKGAMILSIFLPGLGQMVLGQFGKGIAMLLGVALGWIITLTIPKGFSELLKSFSQPADPNPLVFVTLAIAVGCHLWSLFDAASSAKRFTPKRIEKPVPPSDRNYEI